MSPVLFLLFLALRAPSSLQERKKGIISPNVRIDLDRIKGLLCFQCVGRSDDLPPSACDLIRQTKEDERINMTFQCPSYQGSFCFTHIRYRGEHRTTYRGCAGNHDLENNTLKEGCVTNSEEQFCLCKKRLCNGGVRVQGAGIVFVCFLVVVGLNKLFLV